MGLELQLRPPLCSRIRLGRQQPFEVLRPGHILARTAAKMPRKLAAKSNERLPFAWRATACEGQDDIEAIMTLAERISINLRRLNIAVTDCGQPR